MPAANPLPLSQQLLLFQYLLGRFGFASFNDLQARYGDTELNAATPGSSPFYSLLATAVSFSTEKLRGYDANVLAHLAAINRGRATPIRLKYYQYFSLLFTEYYLDHYLSDADALPESLNESIRRHPRRELRGAEPFLRDDLNKLAYWNATGSGKTFILHINILQWRHWAGVHGVPYRAAILLTPSEDLSRQHLEELRASGIAAHYYWEDKAGAAVKVIDINKIREETKGTGVTIKLSEFERDNALFVDEGHKGNTKEDSAWRAVRAALSERGFAFEYSATFGQLQDKALLAEYGKCIVFDYSYGHFWEDGYGKDYWIHNLSYKEAARQQEVTAILDNTVTKRQYLLQNLLLFAQQKVYALKNREALAPYAIESPLLVFVGTSVEPKATTQTDKAENTAVISDVKTVLDFFRDLLDNRDVYVAHIYALMQQSDKAIFGEDYYTKLTYLFGELPDAGSVYSWCLKTIFNHDTGGALELYTLRAVDGEIALKVQGADHYFGLIYIGDVGTFKSPLEGEYAFERDVTGGSQFAALSDVQSNPVNVLIGARKFIEGWNNYRVSSIGLINFGRSKGAQIIQLFGRGIRLRGKGGSLKRSKGDGSAPAGIGIVETLNIFGLRADYMKQFRDDLEKEGIHTRRETFSFPVKLTHDLTAASLITLERDSTAPSFQTTSIVELSADADVRITIDLSSKKFVGISGRADLAQDVAVVPFRFSAQHLGIIDWEAAYTDLLGFKARAANPAVPNLQIKRVGSSADRHFLRELVEGLTYTLLLDKEPPLACLEDIEALQKLAQQLLRQYAQRFYQRHLRIHEGKYLTTGVLSSASTNITAADWVIEVQTTDEAGAELEGIQAQLSLIQSLLADTSYPQNLKGDERVAHAWIDAHLYQPLLKDEEQQSLSAGSKKIITTVRPAALNAGEAAFVGHLKSHIAAYRHKWADYDFYLLRNMSRGKGLGFYFSAEGFYPDFMLWIKHKADGKQYLTFIDPHGLRNEVEGWSSAKLQLHKHLKEREAKLGNNNLVLNSFVLQPPSQKASVSVIEKWSREDDVSRTIPLKDYAASRHVYEISNEGSASGEGGYIDRILSAIVGHSVAATPAL